MTSPPVAGVVGWPVAHSKSPFIHRFWLGKLGLDGDYSRFPVHPDNLSEAIRALPALGLRGVNVTVPHKVAVMAQLDHIDPSAAGVGAVNTVVVEAGRLTGYNTDVAGVLEPLATVTLAATHAVVVGAGGAARGVLAALVARQVGAVTLVNRDTGKAAALLSEFGLHGDAVPFGTALAPAALLVNASSLGMAGQPPLPLDVPALARDTLIYDIVYLPLETPLLAEARARGHRTIDGLAMLIGQAAAAFKLFYGQPAPRDCDAELRVLLTA